MSEPMPLVAGLPMYDWPEVAAATDELWMAISQNLSCQGVNAPASLWRPENLEELWGYSGLLVGQMCGLPFVKNYQGQVSVLGSFDFSLGGPPGSYHSVLVCHRDNSAKSLADFSGQRAAINEVGSQSGHAALIQAAQGCSVRFSQISESGSHRDSIKMVATGQVAAAAIDAVSWCLALDHEPAAQDLQVLQRTAPTPGVPLITAPQQAHLRPQINQAITEAVRGLDLEVKTALYLTGFLARPASDYEVFWSGEPE